MNLRAVGAYRMADRVVIHSQLHTDFGSFACEPFYRFDRSAAADELGRGVSKALDACRAQPAMPNVKETTKAFFAGVGVKSNGQLQRSAICVGITSGAQGLEFCPTHNGGTSGDRKGFQPLSEATALRLLASATPAEIGAALDEAFGRCTTIYT